MIRTLRPLDRPDPGLERVAKANGFSLPAGVGCEGHQKNKRERLCRYIARSAVATPRLSLSSTGKVAYTLCLAKCYFLNDIRQLMVAASDDRYYSRVA
jgi:hypothetical protein